MLFGHLCDKSKRNYEIYKKFTHKLSQTNSAFLLKNRYRYTKIVKSSEKVKIIRHIVCTVYRTSDYPWVGNWDWFKGIWKEPYWAFPNVSEYRLPNITNTKVVDIVERVTWMKRNMRDILRGKRMEEGPRTKTTDLKNL